MNRSRARTPGSRAHVRRSVWLIATALGAVLVALVGGCATTRPYEREDLARPEMALDPDPDEAALRQHFLGTREGAVGGGGGEGGGCGCN